MNRGRLVAQRLDLRQRPRLLECCPQGLKPGEGRLDAIG
jgi:hypothetical protein